MTPLRRLPYLALVLLAACGKSEAKKGEEIKNCSAISLDAPGISTCLIVQYRWDSAMALTAARTRQRELDSIAAFQRDSAWALEAAKHTKDLSGCIKDGGDVSRCLQDNHGWDAEHAAAAFDSLWHHDAPKHRDAIRACQRQRKSNVSSCLVLYYKWDSKHALAVGDSLERERMRAIKSR